MGMEKYKATIQSLKKSDHGGISNKTKFELELWCKMGLHLSRRLQVSDSCTQHATWVSSLLQG